MGRKNWLTVLLLFFGMVLTAQTTDLARIEYLYLPFSKSGNSISRYRALIQAPIPLDKERKRIIVIGMEYRYVDINIEDPEDVAAFNGHLVTSVQQTNSYVGYVWKHNDHWRFGAKAGVKIETDWAGSLVNDDLIYEIGAYAINDRKKNPEEGKKPYRLIVGLTYSTVPGRWYPLPIINYFKQFRPNWTYTLGVPKSNVRNYLNNSHKDAIQAFATLDNIYANIQQNFRPISSENQDGKMAESIQQTIVLLGLGYEHYFMEDFLFYAYAAHSVYNDFRLEDGDGKKLYKINTENSPYFRVGLKLKY
ncbi:hypothetical protein EI546_04135 [Aequorivita sp. H23M31]|uniref:Uncharacterized protein n=1 Tax=Aequorivita ciconiae TaxID=2494375 RepID=A0A410G145_9FLAO|nr:hypothetical protein [Aequorivita sp. H23M31]QAA80965.1 hypothetical protein EI546_04135 [Aequorivita sp. H23M31]